MAGRRAIARLRSEVQYSFVDFRILGPLEVWEGDQRVSVGGTKQRAVLAILLLEANRVVSTDRLIELVWGDEPPETVANTLQVTVSQLRKVLEPDHVRGSPYRVLISQDPGYMIRVAPEQLDLGRFEYLQAQAIQANADGDSEMAAERLREALALWRGTPFSDLSHESYVLAEANRLSEIRLRAIEDRIEADLALGRHGELIPELKRIVDEYPLRERFRGQLMLALYRSGRQAEASNVFHNTRALLVEELGIEPGPELQKLLTAILKQDPVLDIPRASVARGSARRTNLPLQLTSFVGRTAEFAEVKRLLLGNHCVTLVGSGGVGKTRLAIEAASQLADDFTEGARLIELAPLANASLLPQMVANSFGVREHPFIPLADAIVQYLQKRHTLLVMDNCEHLIQPASELIETILRACPQVWVLATSREALRIDGEAVYTVPALSVPTDAVSDMPREPAQYEAIRLFCDRGSIDIASLAHDQETSRAVVDICRHLDGVPLAIELAAATLRILPAKQLSARLDDRFRLLTTGHRTALPRQQTLEASIAWSYDLLADTEKTLLRRLSIFGGDFSLEAAEAVCAGQSIQPEQVFSFLRSLVSKSLVTVVPAGTDVRYGLLETVREYAATRLARLGEDAALGASHLNWYVGLVDKAVDALHGPDLAAWLTLLDREQPNLRLALTWALAQNDQTALRIARALTWFWMIRGQLSEGSEWLRLALQKPADPPVRARGLTSAGIIAFYQADYGACSKLLAESVGLHEDFDDPLDRSQALTYWGVALLSQGDTANGHGRLEQGVDAALEVGDTWELAMALNNLGLLNHLAGDRSPRPRAQLEAALKAARGVGDAWHSEFILDSLAQVAIDNDDIDSARRYWLECMTTALRLGDKFVIPGILEGFGRVAYAQSEFERSLRLLGAASNLYSEKGAGLTPMEQQAIQLTRERSWAALDQASADSAWGEGSLMTMEEAIEYGLAGLSISEVPAANPPAQARR